MPRKVTLTGRKERERTRRIMREKRKKENKCDEYIHRHEDARRHDYVFNLNTNQRELLFELCNICHIRWYDSNVEKSGTCAICQAVERELISSSENIHSGLTEGTKKLLYIKDKMNSQINSIKDEDQSKHVHKDEEKQNVKRELKIVTDIKLEIVSAQDDTELLDIKVKEELLNIKMYNTDNCDIKEESFEIEEGLI